MLTARLERPRAKYHWRGRGNLSRKAHVRSAQILSSSIALKGETMSSLRSPLQRRRPRISGFALVLIAVVSVALCPIAAWSEDDLRPNVVIQWNNAALQ